MASHIQFAFNSSSSAMKVFCVDISGSTGGVRAYHGLSGKIFDQIQKGNHTIIGWDSNPQILSDTKYQQILSRQQGFGGTLTSAIASGLNQIPPTKIDLIILTDGEVDPYDIAKCDSMMDSVTKRHEISSVTAFISSLRSANCSVLAPFLRGEWNSHVFHETQTNGDMNLVHVMDLKEREELMNLVKNATTEVEINAVYDRLVSLVTAMTMGKRDGDPQMRSIILDMFARIKANIKKELSQSSVLARIEAEFFDTNDISVQNASELNHWYQSLFNGTEFQSKIDFLLKMCDGKLSHLFDPQQIRQAALQRATAITEQQDDSQLAQIVPSDTVTPVECPIMLDSSANQCVMLTGTPLFSEIPKSMQDAIMSNTFFAISLADSIKTRLDHGMSLEAYLSLPNQSESPLTRAQIYGVLVLGADPVSVKATNYAIGQMLLGKAGIIGNPDVWFYVIYNTIKSGCAPWLTTYLPMFENQLRYRMEHSTCNISMSGLPTHMQLKTKFGVALRFVLSQAEIGMPKDKSSFPIFSGSTQHIIRLLDMYGVALPSKLVKYCTMVQTLSRLVGEVKQLHLPAFETKYRALIGNFFHIKREDLTQTVYDEANKNGWFFEFVPVDGAHTTMPSFASHMSHDMVNLTYNLARLIVDSNTESTTAFTLLESVTYDDSNKFYLQPTAIADDWTLYRHPYAYPNDDVKIHPHTLRPYTFNGSVHWKTQFEHIYNEDKHFSGVIFDATPEQRPSGDVFCGARMYGNFIETFGFHPTLSDFVLYCFKTVKNSQYNHSTIPFVEFCESIIESYNFTRIIPVPTFLSIYERSRNREERIKIEQSQIE